jgi:NADPH:quinone reductase-like Zn-dependent oxidoreductase
MGKPDYAHPGGLRTGQTVLAPAIGGAVGNAVTLLARAQGAGKAISTTSQMIPITIFPEWRP